MYLIFMKSCCLTDKRRINSLTPPHAHVCYRVPKSDLVYSNIDFLLKSLNKRIKPFGTVSRSFIKTLSLTNISLYANETQRGD